MKRIFTLLFLSTFLFTSCSNEGPQGPPGPEGPAGPVGDDGFGTVIDFENVDLNAGTNYTFQMNFDEEGIEVFETDAVLVYIKDGEDGTADGLPVEIFRPLPQTYYVDGEAVQYNYEFTFFDVWVFLEGTADLSTLGTAFTEDLVVRIIVLPADFAATLDTSNMNNVLKAMDVQEKDVKKASL